MEKLMEIYKGQNYFLFLLECELMSNLNLVSLIYYVKGTNVI